ncbi:MAG: sulfatase family protein [Spirochaetales bacterium]
MPTIQQPNIILIYADDLGFGDIGCYGATTIPTPNLDRLAKGGLRFTQGYATAATCTPSRYSLLCGSYPWRNPDAAILSGDAPMIIREGETTIASHLRVAGYRTGVVGKWHLGLGAGNLDWNEEIERTPNDVGFDTSYIMAATNDRVPCVYVEDRRVVGLEQDDPIKVAYGRPGTLTERPTGKDHPELLRMMYSHGHDGTIINGVSRIGEMSGGENALWKDEEMAEVFANRACRFIEQERDRPFFLYYALHQPHVPRIPGPRFAGTTGHGPRGDVIAELDWCVGQIVDSIEAAGITEETMIVFTSDNGPVLDDGYQDKAVELAGEHKPAGPLRGGKYSMYDGGTRVPTIISWPGRIKPGVADALICQIDFLATLAELVGAPLPEEAGPDSISTLTALLGESDVGREELVVEGMQGHTAFRQGPWSYLPPHEGPAVSATTGTELGNADSPQLYDLRQDLSQIRNLADSHPDKVQMMDRRLAEILASERTR